MRREKRNLIGWVDESNANGLHFDKPVTATECRAIRLALPVDDGHRLVRVDRSEEGLKVSDPSRGDAVVVIDMTGGSYE